MELEPWYIWLLAVNCSLPLIITIWYFIVPAESFPFRRLGPKAVKWYLGVVWLPNIFIFIAVAVGVLLWNDGLATLFSYLAYSSYILVVVVSVLFALAEKVRADDEKSTEPTPEPTPTPTNTRRDYTEAVMQHLQIPQQLVEPVREAVYKYTDSDTYKLRTANPTYVSDHVKLAENITTYATLLPRNIGKVGQGKYWSDFFRDNQYSQSVWYAYQDIPEYLRKALNNIRVEIVIPPNLRTQHAMVVASSGYGKSQLFQSMILGDLETDAACIVIDSQNDLINKLTTRVDRDRLILIDAAACPPALNIFKLGDPGLLEYVFGALDAKMTSKQGMVYRYLARYVMQQDGNISLLLDVLQNPERPYQAESQAERAFFDEYQKPRGQYQDTRQEISRRLLTLLENRTFETMMAQDELKVDIGEAIEQGKVVLINTAKPDTGSAGAALFGRFWLARTMQTVMKGSRKRVNVYADEWADYASDDLEELFTQSRKYNLALTVAFQSLAQMPERLKAVMATNTSIKLAGGVSAEDRANLARQMDCEPEFIGKAKRGTFAAWFRDAGTTYFPVEFGRLEAMPELSRLADIHAEMRRRYSPTPPPLKNPTPEPPKKSGGVRKGFVVDED